MHGLHAATHAPISANGTLDLNVVEKQCAYFLARNVTSVFINGSTGECHSLSTTERRALADRWMQVAKGTAMRVAVHVGSNSLDDASELAAHAQKLGAAAVSILAPFYFKPCSLSTLIDCCAKVAKAAPELPFYFYDIPSLTGVKVSMEEFLNTAPARIPNLAGIKFTNPDLMAYQLALRAGGGTYDIPWGCDEFYLAALVLGAQGAIGSTFNFAPGVYQRMEAAFVAGDFKQARDEQFRSVQLIKILAKRGYMGSAKALMVHLGVPVGAARLPNTNPDKAGIAAMLSELEAIGYFSWKDHHMQTNGTAVAREPSPKSGQKASRGG